MHRRDFIATAIAATTLSALPNVAIGATTHTEDGTEMTSNPANRPQAGYAPVAGGEVYYQLHGEGRPMVLLHGGVGAFEMFAPILPPLNTGRQIIGIDLQAHGRTLPFDRPMTFENLASDVAAAIRHLGYEKADVMGYSMGGMTALRTAIDHPEIVDRLVLVSTAYAFAGWHDYNQQGMRSMNGGIAEMMKQSPMYELYAKIAPDPSLWAKSLDQIGTLTGADYDWSTEVPSVKASTLVVAGDWDAVRISHTSRLFELLGGGTQDAMWDGSGMNAHRLAIIPGATHYSVFMDPRMADAVNGFLGA